MIRIMDQVDNSRPDNTAYEEGRRLQAWLQACNNNNADGSARRSIRIVTGTVLTLLGAVCSAVLLGFIFFLLSERSSYVPIGSARLLFPSGDSMARIQLNDHMLLLGAGLRPTKRGRCGAACVEWPLYGRLSMSHREYHGAECFSFHWDSLQNVLRDCIELGPEHWFHSDFLSDLPQPFSSMEGFDESSVAFERLFVSPDGGIGIAVTNSSPVFVRAEANQLCLQSQHRTPYHAAYGALPSLSYRVCLHSNVDVLVRLLREKVPASQLQPEVVWSLREGLEAEDLETLRSRNWNVKTVAATKGGPWCTALSSVKVNLPIDLYIPVDDDNVPVIQAFGVKLADNNSTSLVLTKDKHMVAILDVSSPGALHQIHSSSCPLTEWSTAPSDLSPLFAHRFQTGAGLSSPLTLLGRFSTILETEFHISAYLRYYLFDHRLNFISSWPNLIQLIPHLIGQSLASGTPFPVHVTPDEQAEPELFFRIMHVAMFAPVMGLRLGQLEPTHIRLLDYLLKLRAKTIEPLLSRLLVTHEGPLFRPMAWSEPTEWRRMDQFMIGDDLIVAPVIIASQTERDVYLPEGIWHNPVLNRTFSAPQLLSHISSAWDDAPLFFIRRRPVISQDQSGPDA